MKAVVSTINNIKVADVDAPRVGPGEVRVAVAAAGVNPVDAFVDTGAFHEIGWVSHNPVGLGWDLAGTVTEVGEGVDLAVGGRVAALSDSPDKAIGGQAEEIVLAADKVATVPEGLGLVEAATVPLNALTADQALDLLGEADGTLLVTGAAGSVGAYAVQLGAERGWKVVGLAREDDRAFVEGLGGTVVTSFEDAGDVEAVIDAAVTGQPAVDVLDGTGRLVTVAVGEIDVPEGVQRHGIGVRADGARLAELLTRTAAGELPVRVRATYPLDRVDAAYADLASGGRGRVLLTLE